MIDAWYALEYDSVIPRPGEESQSWFVTYYITNGILRALSPMGWLFLAR